MLGAHRAPFNSVPKVEDAQVKTPVHMGLPEKVLQGGAWVRPPVLGKVRLGSLRGNFRTQNQVGCVLRPMNCSNDIVPGIRRFGKEDFLLTSGSRRDKENGVAG